MRLRPILMTCAALSALMPAVSPARTQASTTPTKVTGEPTKAPTTQPASAAEIAAAKASVKGFIDKIDIPYESFTLPNGLRVLVHSDRSVSQVSVGVWYDVGAKHEPAGRSGFAHLFEHLMFNGSENVPGDYLKPLLEVGADVNGSTSADRTNYYQTVPTPALDLALFMESDRMGHLLGAINQASLDEQRGVVQNEKRQGDNSPTSIIAYKTRAALYPAGHPYGHSVIGSMKDLQAADLADVRQWFKTHYGPNNALLILAGDIDVPTARRLVTKYFGSIAAGPRNVRPAAAPVPMTRTISETVTAPVTAPMIVRRWPIPGADSKDGIALDVVMEVMGGGSNNVLSRRLVREQQLFQYVGVGNTTYAQAGEFNITGTVRPGVDPKVAAAALDREIDAFLRSTPSEDEVTRFITRYTYDFVRRLEGMPQRAAILGEHAMSAGTPDAYKANLHFYAGMTPTTIAAVARRWLARPRYELTVMPGPRVTPDEDAGIDGSATAAATPPAPAPVKATGAIGNRGPLPQVGPAGDAKFPPIERARLANGIEVSYSHYPSVPFTIVNMTIDGGTLVEPKDQDGTMETMYAMLDDSFAGHDEHWIEQRKERLGLSLSVGAGMKSAGVMLDAPNNNLGTGLEMMRQMVTVPTFQQTTLDRIKREKLDRFAAQRLNPNLLLSEVVPRLVDGGSPFNGLKPADAANRIRQMDMAGIKAAFARWVRPERATIAIVSDQPLAALLPQLERTLGMWRATGTPQPLPTVTYTPQPQSSQIVLIDLPGSVQATVTGKQLIPITEPAPTEALNLGNKVLAGGFTSRVNMNLREDKHWTYGFIGYPIVREYSSYFAMEGTIQQDKVGPAIGEVMKEVSGVMSDRPITALEFDRVKTAAIGEVAVSYTNRYSILGELGRIREFGRPDSYPGQLSQRYRAVTREAASDALRTQLNGNRWIWGVVGNAAIIRPQLEKLGLPITVMKPEEIMPPM